MRMYCDIAKILINSENEIVDNLENGIIDKRHHFEMEEITCFLTLVGSF